MNVTKTFQFESLVAGTPKSPVHTDFMAAWNDMYQHVNQLLKAGQLSHQVLETAMWIEVVTKIDDKIEDKSPMFFYDARDLAYEYRLEELTQQLKNLNEWMTWEDAENEAKFYLSIAKVQYPREKDLK